MKPDYKYEIRNLKSHNESRLTANDILTGRELRRLRRGNKSYKNYK